MSEKTRLLKLAPEIKVEVKEIVAYLKQEGMKKVSASSFVEAEVVQDIKDHFSGKKTQKTKAAAPEKPSQPEIAEKPRPAPEGPAKTEEAAEPATVATAPADAPPETAPPTIVEVQPKAPVPETVPTAPPAATPPPATDQPAVVLQPAAKLEPGITRPSPAAGTVAPPRKPAGVERPSPTETIRQHLSRSGQIRTRPFLSRARQGAPARPLSLPTGTRPTSGFPPQRRPLTPFPRPPCRARRTAPGPPPGQAGPAASWRAA